MYIFIDREVDKYEPDNFASNLFSQPEWSLCNGILKTFIIKEDNKAESNGRWFCHLTRLYVKE